MSLELADGLRGVVLIGLDGSTYRVIGVNADGYLVALMTGTDGSSLVTIKTDTDGNLVAVMKGEYSGTLKTIATDNAGQIIAILKGASGYNLAIDPDGYLTTVIKGDYNGALRTVALDDDGRLSAFIIDSQDAWGELLAIGNAELAARLGASQVYDRRGQVYLYETFKNGLQAWDMSTGGTGASVDLDPTSHVIDGYSVKLTAGSDSIRKAYIDTKRNIALSSRFGLEMSFAIEDDTDYIWVNLNVANGTTLHVAAWKLSLTDGKLYVIDDDANEQQVCAVSLAYQETFWYYNIKMVIDIDNDRYERVLFAGNEYDMTAHALATSADSTIPHVIVAVFHHGRSGYNDVVNIDNVVVTVQEPANS